MSEKQKIGKRMQEKKMLRVAKLKRQKQQSLIDSSNISNWFKLDNAATVYPSVTEERWSSVFRMSVILKEGVNPSVLQESINEVIKRFPSFNVSLRSGMFWHYFDTLDNPPLLTKETKFPCAAFNVHSVKDHLIRFVYNGCKISLECFHSVADGRSALCFLNTVLYRYFELLGKPLSSYDGCLNYLDIPKPEEVEDSFFANSNNKKHTSHKEACAFKIKGTDEEAGVINTIDVTMSVAEVKEIAKKYNCNIYIFLVSAYAYTLSQMYKNEKKPIKISVPIDLRRFFNSESLRNFSAYINIATETKGKEHTFEEIIEEYKRKINEIDVEKMQNFINSNISLQKNLFIKLTPLFIKNLIIKICFKSMGENYQTIAASNIGIVKAPAEFNNYIEKYMVNLGRTKYNKKSLGLISFGDNLCMCLSSSIKENKIEREYLRFLASLGVNILVESNRRDIYA